MIAAAKRRPAFITRKKNVDVFRHEMTFTSNNRNELLPRGIVAN